MNTEFFSVCCAAYAEVLSIALPVALFFAGCNIIINTVIDAFTRGKLRLGGK